MEPINQDFQYSKYFSFPDGNNVICHSNIGEVMRLRRMRIELERGFCVISLYNTKEKLVTQLWLDYSFVDHFGYFIHDESKFTSTIELQKNNRQFNHVATKLSRIDARLIEINTISPTKFCAVVRLFLRQSKGQKKSYYIDLPKSLLPDICCYLNEGQTRKPNYAT